MLLNATIWMVAICTLINAWIQFVIFCIFSIYRKFVELWFFDYDNGKLESILDIVSSWSMVSCVRYNFVISDFDNDLIGNCVYRDCLVHLTHYAITKHTGKLLIGLLDWNKLRNVSDNGGDERFFIKIFLIFNQKSFGINSIFANFHFSHWTPQ